MKPGQGLVHHDEDRYNFQSDNIGKKVDSDGEEEEDYD